MWPYVFPKIHRYKAFQPVVASCQCCSCKFLALSPYCHDFHCEVVHFIRHGHGYHNYPLHSLTVDPRLTETGWNQTKELKEHILRLRPPLNVEVLMCGQTKKHVNA